MDDSPVTFKPEQGEDDALELADLQLRLADPNASLLALYGDLANAGLPHLSDEKTSDISPRTTGVTSEYTKSILIERLLGSNAYLRYVGERVDMYTEKKKKKSQDK